LKSRFLFASILATSTLLSACGGGSGSDSNTPKPTISSVSTDQLLYRKLTNITIEGQNLDRGFNISNTGCLKITEVAGGTASKKIFSCKMVGVGSVAMKVTAGDGSSLYSGTMLLPLATPKVTMTTSMGPIAIELNPAKAPVTVDNFLQYVENGFYVNKIFHRVIAGFMIQGGGFTTSLEQAKTLDPIKLEAGNGLSNIRGSIAMARTSVSDSATAQFFINTVNNSSTLDANSSTGNAGYAVFGTVTTGMTVVDNINAVATGTIGALSDLPVTPITINSVVISQ
jgi:cyclophilin family peptidyl-prolyl cis-trans isomerase